MDYIDRAIIQIKNDGRIDVNDLDLLRIKLNYLNEEPESLRKLKEIEENITIKTTADVEHIEDTETEDYITWLHLSDFHIKPEEDYKTTPIFSALQDDIEEMMKRLSINSFDFIIITGDLGYFGKNGDYESVEPLLDDILSYTHISKKKLFIVPGNHDIDREIVKEMNNQLLTNWKSEEEYEKFVKGNKVILNAFFTKFDGFSDFINRYFGGDRSFTINQNFFTNLLTIKGIKVAVIGLNSCLKSGKDGERGKLMITQEQLNKALQKFTVRGEHACRLKDIPIRICFFHHPLNWIDSKEVKQCKGRMFKNIDLLLNGHIHDSDCHPIGFKGNDGIINIIAGSTFVQGLDRGKQCYNIIKIHKEHLTGNGYFRKFERDNDYWVIDTSVGKGTGELELALKKRE